MSNPFILTSRQVCAHICGPIVEQACLDLRLRRPERRHDEPPCAFPQHRALSPPSRQEIHFFDEEARDWAAPDYTALHSLFAPEDGDRLRFDITPIYIFWPPSIERIRAYNPSAKLIFIFRDPFERAWSHWCMEYARGDETLPFAEAIREGRSRLDGLPLLARERRVYTYIERGLYADQVRRVLANFPRGQLLFLRSQNTLRRPTLKRWIASLPSSVSRHSQIQGRNASALAHVFHCRLVLPRRTGRSPLVSSATTFESFPR